jgi:hypothetical protein
VYRNVIYKSKSTSFYQKIIFLTLGKFRTFPTLRLPVYLNILQDLEQILKSIIKFIIFGELGCRICSIVSQPGLTTHHQRSTLKKDQPMGQP